MDAIKSILQLINKSLAGELPLDQLYVLWPEELAHDKFFDTIYKDVESVVEHYPAKVTSIFGSEDPDKYFKRSFEYRVLLSDKELIQQIINENLELNSDLLLLKRIKLIDSNNKSVDSK